MICKHASNTAGGYMYSSNFFQILFGQNILCQAEQMANQWCSGREPGIEYELGTQIMSTLLLFRILRTQP